MNLKNFFTTELKPLFVQAPFHFLSGGVVDLHRGVYTTCDFQKSGTQLRPLAEPVLYDLASLTKPLSLATTYLSSPQIFHEEMTWLLNHQGGLPATALLNKNDWRMFLQQLPIKKSPTLYSDLSALKLQLMIEESTKVPLKQIFQQTFQSFWQTQKRRPALYHWQEIPAGQFLIPPTGFRGHSEIRGEVHDPTAFLLGNFLSHAGLFGEIQSLCEALIFLNRQWNLVEKMQKALERHESSERFCQGWDTPTDLTNTLAGYGCSKNTFGHLGFTGTSLWIDADKNLAHIMLSNATEKYWYERKELNALRKKFGEFVWKNGANILS